MIEASHDETYYKQGNVSRLFSRRNVHVGIVPLQLQRDGLRIYCPMTDNMMQHS